MPTVEGKARTPRAERYLAQLCDHFGHMQEDPRPHDPGGHDRRGHDPRDEGGGRGGHGRGHGTPPAILQVNRDGSHAQIEFDWGHVVLVAAKDVLTVRVHADAAATLGTGQELIARRIETIGRRDHLTVTWQATDPS